MNIFNVGTGPLRTVASFTQRRLAVGLARTMSAEKGVPHYVYSRETQDETRPAPVGKLCWAPAVVEEGVPA